MFSKEELVQRPNYLLTIFQNEIYRQLINYMNTNHYSQKDIAEKLGVSNAYISQILNGNFNFTLKKLIELGLVIGKVPSLEFIDFNEYWLREKQGSMTIPKVVVSGNRKKLFENLNISNKIKIKEGSNNELVFSANTGADSEISDFSYCN